MGDWLSALEAVGTEAALALAGEADLTLLNGDGLLLEREAVRLTGNFFEGFLVCGAEGGSVCWPRSTCFCGSLTWFIVIIVACRVVEAIFPRRTLRSASGTTRRRCL